MQLSRNRSILVPLSIIAVSVLGFSLSLFPLWFGMLAAWFLLAGITIIANADQSITIPLRRLFYSVAFAYPVTASMIKRLLLTEKWPYSWLWLNRIEHFLWATCFGVLVMPLVFSWVKSKQAWLREALIAGIVLLIGNANEFLEYSIRLGYHLDKPHYYGDTMIDLFVNLLGAIFAGELIRLLQSGQDKPCI
ncbi:MAG TPA: hypothetical protein PKL83_00880 [bacterium]|nr:hypothetical protein [bacterium]